MVSTILDPREPKTEWDILIISMIILHFVVFWYTSGVIRKGLTLSLFLLWRTAYNLGIGSALYEQSTHKLLVKKAQKLGLFDAERNPICYRFLRRQLSDKMSSEFDFDSSPVEYTTWLLFRRAVDLILMLDFCSYVLFAVSWSYVPVSHGFVAHGSRWILGWALILFNLWVKLDANRVVGPVGAWHWADFFFIVDADLTFDGVYELCMHPMYSLGYIGYYGISLLACSYSVLFVSIAAHISQFAFLYLVEEPHISKTYSPRNPVQIKSRSEKAKELMSTEHAFDCADASGQVVESFDHVNSKIKPDRVIRRTFDPHRAIDLTQALVFMIGAIFAIFTPQDGSYRSFAIFQAFLWRALHSAVLIITLNGQSETKQWTKHFLKFGESPKKAWQEWKRIYTLSLTVMHTTFVIAVWKCYSIPVDWHYSTVTLRHVLGVALIAMHIWTSVSIYNVLGDFGWYFGDFFVEDRTSGLKYTGVYRYLNNPERIVYSFWGLALLANSSAVMLLAIEAQFLNLVFLTFIERPHMIKLYGSQVRKEAGFTRSLKSMPIVDHPQVKRKVKEIEGSFDRVLEVAIDSVQTYLAHARPHLNRAVEETKLRISRYQNSLTFTRVEDKLDLNPEYYSLNLKKSSAGQTYGLGEPIQVEWKAPAGHSIHDWIGVYKITDNVSTDITRVSSKGRWSAVHAAGFEDHNDNVISESTYAGTVEFRGNTVPWANGCYEFRYHHGGKHNVMSISQPFEIQVEANTETNYYKVEQDLLQLVRQVLASEKGTELPTAPDDEIVFADDAEKCASRIAYGINKRYGIEFAWQLLASDSSVRKYTAMIAKSKRILAPFISHDHKKDD